MPDAIRFENVSHRYDDTANPVLSGVSFSLAQGEMAFLTGPSGAGKSTILQLIGGLQHPVQGEVFVNERALSKQRGRALDAHRRAIGMVFQDARLVPHLSAFDNVALPLLIRGQPAEDIGSRVRAALDAVGLRGHENAAPATLSSGEQQRVGIARAIVARPALLLADEPTGNLDLSRAREVLQLFARFNEVGTSVLIVTHAVNLVAELPYRVMRLQGGHLAQLNRRTADVTTP
ncbi:MAG: ATP-binding cassette domain-containing protein [Nevskiaceae bacterium]|nr:MAG: ATP-binding cassette domain-containing protein [Nevskiaceae bacterium]TBR73161.1 MAG: ATP-binding cassette domain-containing protein [Nevskiaceae bacterium]